MTIFKIFIIVFPVAQYMYLISVLYLFLCRDQTDEILSSLAIKHLSFSSDVFKNMLYFLMKEFKWIVKRFLPRLERHISDVVMKRGCGKDKKLE